MLGGIGLGYFEVLKGVFWINKRYEKYSGYLNGDLFDANAPSKLLPTYIASILLRIKLKLYNEYPLFFWMGHSIFSLLGYSGVNFIAIKWNILDDGAFSFLFF